MRHLVGALVAASTLIPVAVAAGNNYLVYVGTYTRPGKSQGIYAWRFDSQSGTLTPLGLAAATTSPSFLAVDANGTHLYAVGEVGNFGGKPAGSVSAFAIEKATGKLRLLNQATSGGPGPCFVTVDKSGKNVLIANYSGGSVEVIPLKSDGSLGEPSSFIQHTGKGTDPGRQEGPHAHSVNLSPDGKFAIVADLGLNKLMVYRFDAASGKLTPNDPPFVTVAPGSGPRHFTFAPDGKTAYVINEMAQTVTGFHWDAGKGQFTPIDTVSSLPAGMKVAGNSTAEILMHPSGKFLYGSNRGHDSIAVFTVARDGKLTLIQNEPTQGKVPRNFRIDPSGKWLFAANQNSDSVVLFRIDPQSGKLAPTGQKLDVFAPVCVKFVAEN